MESQVRVAKALLFMWCFAWVACGGSGLPPEGSVSVAVTVARNPIAVGSSVGMTATVSGYSGNMAVKWLIQETYDRNEQTCSYKQGQEPATPFAICPEGYLTYEDVNTPMQSTYHAPPAEGTYHVTFAVVLVPSLSETRAFSGTAALVVQ